LALWAALALAGCAGFEGKPAVPTTGPEVVAVIQRIVNSDALSRDDLYTEKSLRRLFGDDPKIRIVIEGPTHMANVSGFSGMSEFALPASRGGLADGIYIQMSKGVLENGDINCRLQLDIVGFFRDMNFDSVVARLGPGWYRDRSAEDARIDAQRREWFNPPPPEPIVPMGNAIVVYGAGQHKLRFEFSPAGRLAEIFLQSAKC